MNKKQKSMYENYNRAFNNHRATELFEVYGNYSHEKQKGLEYCKSLQYKLNGYNGTIVGHSSHFFSYAFKFMDLLTGEENLCYCTHCNDYKFTIDE